jgi:hypothetical protein
VETPLERLIDVNRTLAECMKFMGVECAFNLYCDGNCEEWVEMSDRQFHALARRAFQKLASAKMMDWQTSLAEETLLLLSQASGDRKTYKEVEAYFDEVWDGEPGSVKLSLARAVKKYNVRFTEKRQRV